VGTGEGGRHGAAGCSIISEIYINMCNSSLGSRLLSCILRVAPGQARRLLLLVEPLLGQLHSDPRREGLQLFEVLVRHRAVALASARPPLLVPPRALERCLGQPPVLRHEVLQLLEALLPRRLLRLPLVPSFVSCSTSACVIACPSSAVPNLHLRWSAHHCPPLNSVPSSVFSICPLTGHRPRLPVAREHRRPLALPLNIVVLGRRGRSDCHRRC